MSQKIQVRRGTDAARQSVTFDQGEPVYTTDTKKIYFGDGSTAGGIPIGSFDGSLGDSFVIIAPQTGSNKIANGTLLRNAIIDAGHKNPYDLPRSKNNSFSIFLYPATYQMTGVSISIPRYTSIVGIGSKENIIIDTVDNTDLYFGFCIDSGHVNLENFVSLQNYISFMMGRDVDNTRTITGVKIKDVACSGDQSSTFISSQVGAVFDIELDNISNYHQSSLTSLWTDMPSTDIRGAIIKNCDWTSKAMGFFSSSMANPISKVEITNCAFHSVNQTLAEMFRATGFMNSVVSNCIFVSGNISDNTPSQLQTNKLIFKNCCFYDLRNIQTHTYQHCLFLNTQATISAVTAAVNISTGPYFPAFYDCNFVSSIGTSVSGEVGYSGLFVNCTFNKPPFTGATGLFGPQGSRYDARYV